LGFARVFHETRPRPNPEGDSPQHESLKPASKRLEKPRHNHRDFDVRAGSGRIPRKLRQENAVKEMRWSLGISIERPKKPRQKMKRVFTQLGNQGPSDPAIAARALPRRGQNEITQAPIHRKQVSKKIDGMAQNTQF